jgi:alkylation response protein AidB-like acyl-CoA dehydrogenase
VKLVGSTVELRRHRIGVEIAGSEGVAWRPGDPAEPIGLRWLGARTKTIAGGSTEIQLNQVSERVLGLPREPSPDKDLPFREVTRRRR